MAALEFEIDADGIALLTWNMPGRSMNVLNPASLTEYAEAVERILADPAVKGAVVTSAKPTFIVGADLAWLAGLAAGAAGDATPERARKVLAESVQAQEIFRRVETGGKPFAAAINGTALGGGFELCLACHRRFAAAGATMQLGLPEAKVGLLPGAGGTQRMLRMLGPLAALPLLLEGRAMTAEAARDLGLVDELAAAADLVAAAKAWVRSAPPEAAVKPWDQRGYTVPGADPRTGPGAAAFAAANARQREKTLGNYPALDAIQALVYRGMLVPMDTALKIESRYFARLMLHPTARNMIRTQFFSLQKANRLAARPSEVPRRAFRKIGVLGAGLMGAGIAHVAAEAGLEVVVIDVSEAAASRAVEHVRRLQDRAMAAGRIGRGGADAVIGRIAATTDYEALRGADLVIEAVFEDRAVKADVTARAEAVLREEAIFASNTSTLPITGLAENSVRPERFIGLHFFSPVERMPLLEIIRGRQTGDAALAAAMDFARRIRKTPIVVNDSRGFFTSRVFQTYTREAVLMLAEGVKPALIENAGRAAGMPVAPLALCDEVALSLLHHVTLQTRRDLGASYVETAADPIIAEMVERLGRPGKKAGRGFYDYPDGDRKRLWPELSGRFAPLLAVQPDVDEVKTRLLAIQALEAARCLEEGVISDPAEGDIGAILGWGFAPWTGGPFSYIDTLGAARFVELCDRFAGGRRPRFAPGDLLRRMAREGGSFHPLAMAA